MVHAPLARLLLAALGLLSSGPLHALMHGVPAVIPSAPNGVYEAHADDCEHLADHPAHDADCAQCKTGRVQGSLPGPAAGAGPVAPPLEDGLRAAAPPAARSAACGTLGARGPPAGA